MCTSIDLVGAGVLMSVRSSAPQPELELFFPLHYQAHPTKSLPQIATQQHDNGGDSSSAAFAGPSGGMVR